ncbi:hypothetical protein Glove_363g15 [Diversispora epigaea]|uniref:Uncharacterized protein n=1 Tax=Diversispora epigaea TaxID=1348612 RepID=A0A397HD78_9GLOM|nr:hypothetical protein Glove_363g15 [Diversispora epigaea]
MTTRLGQKSKVRLNDEDFFITIKTGSNNTTLLPVYCYQSGLYVITETIMGWNDENILKILKEDIQFTPVNISIGNIDIFIYSIGISSHEK